MNRHSTWLIKLISAMCIVFFIAAPGWCDEGKSPTKQTRARQNGEGVARQMDVEQVTIAKKSLENVTTTAGKRYALTDDTIIIGLDGHQVSTRKMLVPCDAEISFETEEGRRKAVYIKIMRIGKDASSAWTSEKAE